MRSQPLSGKLLNFSTILLLCAVFLELLAVSATAQVSPGRPSRSAYSASTIVQPVANAGPPQLAVTGASVLLDGSRSLSGSGAPLSYHWNFISVPDGASPVLSNADAVNPKFMVPKDGSYVLELTVSDGTRSSSARVVISTVSTPPLADAGSDQAVLAGSVVKLNGGRSFDPDGDKLTFQWRLTYKPVDSFASLSSPSAIAPTFLADVSGTYVAQLTVSDSHNLTSTASVTITTRDIAPKAVSGPSQRVTTGSTVNLSAAGTSDPNGDATTISWNIISRPTDSSAFITAPNSITPSFVPDTRGTYVLQLTVTDSQGNSSYSTVLVTTDPKPPTARLGQNRSVAPNDVVTLDAAASSDDDGVPLSYRWSLLSKPNGSNATIPADLNASGTSFIADQPGEYLAQVVVSNGIYTSAPTTMLITAAASGGYLVLSPNPIDFGSQPVGKTSSPMGLTITNPTNTPVQVLSILTSGSNPGDFNIFNLRLPLLVNPNSASLVSVLFTPGDAGPRSARYIVNDDSGGLPNIVQLSGVGTQGTPKIELSPTSIPFGDQAVNTLSAPIRFTVTNTGDGPLWITNISFGGQNPNDFILPLNFAPPSPTAPLTIAPNSSTTIPIVFGPKAAGARNATVLLADNALGSPHSISVSGNGTGGGLNISPDSLIFADQQVGVASSPSILTLTNTGTTDIKINSLTFIGSNPSDFSTTTATPLTVTANGGTATISVKFTPGAAGSRSATLVLTPESGSPYSVAVSGKGVSQPAGLTLSPTSINFPNQDVNTTSNPVPVTVTNGLNQAVTLSGLLLLGANAGDFTINGIRTPVLMPAGSTTTFNVLFTPHGTGPRTAAIVINNDGGATLRVELAGNNGGTGTPGISLNPSPLGFGDQAVNTTSASKTVTVSNPGTADLKITALSIGGTNSGDFGFAPGFTLPTAGSPLTVAAGQSTTIPLVFKPTVVGSRSATLLFTHNVTGGQSSVTLNGNGTQPPTGVSVSPSSITFADQNINTESAASLVTVTNNTAAAIQVTQLMFTGTNATEFSTTTVTPVTVPANGSTTIPVKFKPTATGQRTGTLTVKDNSGGSDHTVALSGKGVDPNSQPALVISPTALNFPMQALNTTSAPMRVTITNNYSEETRIITVALLGANAGDFLLTGVPYPPDEQGGPFWPYIMPPGSTAFFNVLFTPRGDGVRTAAVVITDDTHKKQYRVDLVGNNPTPVPGITISPTSLGFGDQGVNSTSSTQSVTVSNPGTAALQITGLSFGGTNPGDFVFPANFTPPTPGSPLTVAPGASTIIPVGFKPTALGTRNGTLALTHNAAGSPSTVTLSGNGVENAVTVSPSTITFADQLINTASAASQVTVKNFTNATVQITALMFSGTNGTDFSTTSSTPITLAANGGSTTIPVTFKPGAVGTRSGTLTVKDNSGGSDHAVSLTGKGINQTGVNVSPSAIDFQKQDVSGSGTTASLPLTITNNTPNNVNITSLLLAGLNATKFTTTNSRTPFSLAPNESRIINVLFTPQVVGTYSATLIVADDSGGPSHNVPLSGIGANGVPKISWSPDPLSFGNVSVGAPSTPVVLTITNAGSADLNITGLAITGSNAGDFTFPAGFTPPTPAAPLKVAKGGTATLSVIFTPSLPGARSASLAITDDANFSPQSVSLTGTGVSPQISLSPNPLMFADEAIFTVSGPSDLTISNTGNGELRISKLEFGGANGTEFTFAAGFVPPTAGTPLIIAPNGGTSKVPIVFAPMTVGDRSASFIVTSNAPGSPHSSALAGKAIDTKVRVSPVTLSFGQQRKGTASQAMEVTVTNTGDVAFQITALSFTGDNAGDFKSTDTLPLNVPANNGTAKLNIVFTPGDSGIRTATLEIVHNAVGSPSAKVQLSGVGIKPVFSVMPTSLDFGIQAIPTESAPKSLLIRNLGSAPLLISKITLAGANPDQFKVDTTGPITVDPDNATATINVSFKPTGMDGDRTATLVFEHDGDGSPFTVNLTGHGKGVGAFSISPTIPCAGSVYGCVDFGSIPAGSTSAPQRFTITNIGSKDLFIDFVSRVGANPSEFRYAVFGTLGSSDFPETLAPGQSVDMTITFAPPEGSSGDQTATFLFHDDAEDSPQALPVKGVSIPPPPQIQLTPNNSLTFPQQAHDVTSTPLVISVKNTGGQDLNISSLTLTGANAADFAVAPLAPITIKAGITSTLNVTFTPHGTLPVSRSATLSIVSNAGGGTQTNNISLSGSVLQGPFNITFPNFSLGGNLETLVTAQLEQPAPSNLTVTITSKDPTKLLLSPVSSDPNGTAVGSASITGTVLQGEGKFSGFPGFWVQALASSGTADIEINAGSNYNLGKATVTLTRSGFVLNSSLGTGVSFGTTIGTDAALTVSTAQLDANGAIIGSQPIRAGFVANITVNSGTPATGTMQGNPAIVQPGKTNSSALTFHPVAAGSSVLSIVQPGGFFASDKDHLTATVTAPSIVVVPQSIGFDLVAQGTASLDTAAPAGGLEVTISTGDSTKILLSTNPASTGSTQVKLQVPAGSKIVPAFYLHALASTGSTSLNASAPGYTPASGSVSLFPTAVIINSPNGGGDFTTTSLSSETPLTLSLWQLSSNLRPLIPGTLRPGVSVTASVNSTNPAAGSVLGTQAQFSGGDSTNMTLSFLPSANCPTPCTTNLVVSQPTGFTLPAQGGQIKATINQPQVTLRIIESTIGKNLQVLGSGALEAPAPDNVPVTISSDNPNVLLSLTPTDVGSSSITSTIFIGGGVNSFGFPDYYIQSLAASGTAKLTVSVPGYTSTNFTVTLAPSGIVIAGPSNAIGADFGILLSGGNRPLTVTANVLNPSTLVPTLLDQQIRGGLSVPITVTSSAQGVATLQNNSFNMDGGVDTAIVTIVPQGSGQTTLTVNVPNGFSPPSVGQSLKLTVN